MLTTRSDRCTTGVLHHTFITNKHDVMVPLFKLRCSQTADTGPNRAGMTHFFFGCPVAVKQPCVLCQLSPCRSGKVSAQTTSVTVAALEHAAQETNPFKIQSALTDLWLTVGAAGWQPHVSNACLHSSVCKAPVFNVQL